MKKITFTIIAALVITFSALAAPFELSFVPSSVEAKGLVTGYSAWWLATNAVDNNQWKWFGECPAGQTNIFFDSTNIPNGVWIAASSWNSTNSSNYSVPILFDTVDYPKQIPKPVLPVVPLNAPRLLFIRRL